MVEMYEANHRHQTCYLFRPQKYWDFLAAKHAKDQFLWLTQNGQRQGYIHLRKNGDFACLEDFAIGDHDAITLEQLAKSISVLRKSRVSGKSTDGFHLYTTHRHGFSIGSVRRRLRCGNRYQVSYLPLISRKSFHFFATLITCNF